jgi:hypothetical protein
MSMTAPAGPSSRAEEEFMRGWKKKGDGRWHDSEHRVRFIEHKIQRHASDPISELTLLSEQVDNATTT